MITKLPLYGQYEIDLEHTLCRIVVCPAIPANEKDAFLAQHYCRAMKDTTIHNMYSRWLTATGPMCKNKQLELLTTTCKVFSFAIVPSGSDYARQPVATAAALENLVKTVIDNYGVVTESHYTTFLVDAADGIQPMLFQVVAPGASDVTFDHLTKDLIVEIINQL